MLAIIIGIKVWGGILAGKRFVIACDNQVVVTIINQSISRNSLLQKLMREMCYCLAQLDAQIHARYITSSANTVPDI